MKVTLLLVGKTEEGFIKQGLEIYENRLKHYISFTSIIIADVKNAGKISPSDLKIKEGELILKHFTASDFVVLLDDKGKQFSSVEFSNYIQKQMNSGIKNLCFVVGGAFGFSEQVYNRANMQLSLSKMTLTHQMVRIFFVEQLYRTMTILKGESYHHE